MPPFVGLATSAAMRLPLAVLALIIVNSALFSVSLERMREASASVRHTLSVQKQLSDVLVVLLNAETGQRGYLVTGDPRYLTPYYSADIAIDGLLSTLRLSVGDNPDQVEMVDRVSTLGAAKLAELSQSIAAYSAGQRERALGLVTADDGRTIMSDLRRLLGQMEMAEDVLLSERYNAYAGATFWTYASAVVFIIGTLVLMGVLYWRLRRQLRERSDAAAEVAKYAASLDESVSALKVERNEISGIYEASNFLQTCNTMTELAQLLPSVMRAQFPGSKGEVSLFAASRNQLVTLATWDGWTPSQVFAPDDCWALRRGQPHRYVAGGHAPKCAHLHDDGRLETLCVPLLAHGETIGLLTLGRDPEALGQTDIDVQRKAELVGRQIGLTLTNLRLRETLKELSIRDPLTSVFNRRYLDSIGAKELAHAARAAQPLCVVMLDIDHFKRFNDLHGHAAGDAALVAVAGYLQKSIRDSDWMFRYGGEEFVLLLCDSDLSEIERRLEDLRAGVERLPISYEGRQLPGVTISMGVTVAAAGRRDLAAVLADADAALYEAKRAGRNTFVLSKPQLVGA